MFSKWLAMLPGRERKRKLREAERRKRKGMNKRMRMENTKSNETKDNFSSKEAIDDVEQTARMITPTRASKGSPILLSDLPNDLSGLIISNLDLIDRFHLGLVCKSFLALVRNATGMISSAKTKFGVPCLLLLGEDRKTCNLFNPVHKEKYTINTPSLPADADIHCGKDGWLLLEDGDEQPQLFFFNPLTKATIRLPHLDECFSHACFSCPPTSPDCIVIAMHSDGGSAMFYVCRRGDEQWTEDIGYFTQFYFNMVITKPLLYRDCLFFLGEDGRLASFDPVKRTGKVYKNPKADTIPSIARLHDLIVTSEGRLLRILADSKKLKVHFWKLDYRRKRWKQIDSIGDNTLYVSWRGSFSSKALSTNTKGRVYYPLLRGEEVVSHSSEDGYGSVHLFEQSCWIEPNRMPSSPEELQWISKT